MFALQIAQQRRAWRVQQGAVEISTPDVSWRVDLREDDEVLQVGIMATHPGQSRSGSLVAEMMILANQAVAEYGAFLALCPICFSDRQARNRPYSATAWLARIIISATRLLD